MARRFQCNLSVCAETLLSQFQVAKKFAESLDVQIDQVTLFHECAKVAEIEALPLAQTEKIGEILDVTTATVDDGRGMCEAGLASNKCTTRNSSDRPKRPSSYVSDETVIPHTQTVKNSAKIFHLQMDQSLSAETAPPKLGTAPPNFAKSR